MVAVVTALSEIKTYMHRNWRRGYHTIKPIIKPPVLVLRESFCNVFTKMQLQMFQVFYLFL